MIIPRIKDWPEVSPWEYNLLVDSSGWFACGGCLMRKTLLALLLTLLAASSTRAQNYPSAVEEKGPYLGVLYCPVPEALLDHLPQLPRAGGVMITHVLPESPAAQAGLKKHDVLLHFGDRKINDGNHLARMIQSCKTGQEVRLILLRAGREVTVEAKIALGPVLKIAKEEGTKPPGVAKPGGPATVSVTAEPMEGNRLKVTFEYSDGGRIRSVTCSGDANEIDREIEKMPSKVRDLARAAVQKLRDLNLQMTDTNPSKKPG